MRFKALLAAAFALVVSAIPALAVTPYATLNSVANVAAMKANNLGGVPQIQLRGYYSDSDGGEGAFTYFSGACSEDGGYIIKDGANNCFRRTNLNGDMAQWGMTLGSAYDWNTHGVSSTDAVPVITAAQATLNTLGIYDLHTGGTSLYFATDFSIAAKTIIHCDIVPGTTDNGYLNVPGAIVEAHGVLINRAGNGAGLEGCYLKPYWYTTKPTTAQAGFATLANMVSNGDTGLVCDQASCPDSNLTIIGFDTGLEAVNAPDLVMNNIKIDANVCVFMHTTGGGARFSNVNCFTYITRSVANKTAEQTFTVSSITNSSGLCHVTLTPKSDGATLTDLQYINYLYVARLKSTSAGCQGIWKLSNLDTGAGTADLIGSAVLGPSLYAHWAAGTNIVYTSSDVNVAAGNVINGMDAQGIPTGTTVAAVWDLPVYPAGYQADTGAANAYVVVGTSTSQPCTLADLVNIYWTPANSNTAASTLNVTLNSTGDCAGGTTGALPIVRPDGTALQANDLRAGQNYSVRYDLDSNKWQLKQPKIILSTVTTAAQSAPVLLTGGTNLVNAVCNPCASDARHAAEGIFLVTARVDAGASNGGVAAGGLLSATAYMVGGPSPSTLDDTDKVAGFNCNNCAAFDHMFEAHIENSNATNFSDFRTDSHGNTDNARQVILLVDGQVNNCHVAGVKASKGGHSIVINNAYPNSDDRGACTWDGASVAASAGDLTNVDVEQGAFRMLSGLTNSTSTLTIANWALATRLDVYMPNVTIYYEGAPAIAGTCTIGSTLTAGDVCPELNTEIVTGGQSKAVAAATTYTLLNSDCGSWVPGSASVKSTYTFPASPLAGCEFKFSPALFDILIKLNGKSAYLPGDGSHATLSRNIPFFKENGYFTLTYSVTDDRWHPSAMSRLEYEQIAPLDDQQLMHGQNVFAYDGSQYFTLTPLNGPGGLLISNQMHNLPSLKFDKAGTTNTSLNNFFVGNLGPQIITATASNAGAIKATVTTAFTGANVGDTVHANCFSGTSGEIDGEWTGVITTDTSHVTFTGSTWVANETAICRFEYMVADTGAHAVSARGVDVNSGTVGGAFSAGTATFVGNSYIGGSHAPGVVRDKGTVQTGILYSIPDIVATGTGTSEQILGTYDLPAGFLNTAGQVININACFTHAANTNNVNYQVYFGSVSVQTTNVSTSGAGSCLWTRVKKNTAANSQAVISGGLKGAVAPANVVLLYTAATEAESAAITIKATATDGTSSAGDGTLVYFAISAGP